jgi:hypothetical protein
MGQGSESLGEAFDFYDGGEDNYEESRERQLRERIAEMRTRYEAAKSAKTGSRILCANCAHGIRKHTYQQKFCHTKCKDTYWNTVDDTRRGRASLAKRGVIFRGRG